MRVAHASLVLAIAMILGGCAQWQTSGETLPELEAVQWVDAPQPIEPEAIRLAPSVPRNDVIVLLPKASGLAGAVVVRSGEGPAVLLDKPYAAARIEGPGKVRPFTYDSTRVSEEFGASLAARPGRPASFLLYFLEGKDELTAESQGEVERIFAEISARPDPEVSVVGHTDAVGTVQFNDNLSLQRALRVRDELVRRGIAAERIEVAGRGKREPLIPAPEGVSEAKNRRVEISVR